MPALTLTKEWLLSTNLCKPADAYYSTNTLAAGQKLEDAAPFRVAVYAVRVIVYFRYTFVSCIDICLRGR